MSITAVCGRWVTASSQPVCVSAAVYTMYPNDCKYPSMPVRVKASSSTTNMSSAMMFRVDILRLQRIIEINGYVLDKRIRLFPKSGVVTLTY